VSDKLICVKLTYHGQTMKADLWLHRTAADNVKTDDEIRQHGLIHVMGEDMAFACSKRLKGLCAECKRGEHV
jgi:hypothetical protein